MFRRTAFAVIPAVAMLLAATCPAVAGERTLSDVRGDAPASADITRVRLINGAHQVTVAVKVVNLAGGTDMTLTIDHGGVGRYILRTGGLGKGSLHFARGYNETRVRCPAWSLARYTGTRSIMRVTIPQGCFGDRAGTASFGLTMFQSGGMGADRVAAMPVTLQRG